MRRGVETLAGSSPAAPQYGRSLSLPGAQKNLTGTLTPTVIPAPSRHPRAPLSSSWRAASGSPPSRMRVLRGCCTS